MNAVSTHLDIDETSVLVVDDDGDDDGNDEDELASEKVIESDIAFKFY